MIITIRRRRRDQVLEVIEHQQNSNAVQPYGERGSEWMAFDLPHADSLSNGYYEL